MQLLEVSLINYIPHQSKISIHLQAAAILSHLSPSSASGTSLPDDRSLWPSFLSGGSLPKVDSTSLGQNGTSVPVTSYPVSSSVPGHFLRAPPGSGPRLHDYAIPSTNGASGITQLRPGLISVPTGPEAVTSSGTGVTTPAIPVPLRNSGHALVNGGYHTDSAYRGATSGASASPYENGIVTGTSYVSSNGDGGWSLPRSSIRSVSVSSHSASRSRSGSASDEESVDADAYGGALDEYGPSRYDDPYGRGRRTWKREEDEMEMEMEMEISVGFSVREEDESNDINRSVRKTMEPEWDGLEMDMDMD